MAPGEVLGSPELGIDEAVDALVAYDLAAGIAGEPAGDLLGRPAGSKAGENILAQAIVPLEPAARPAPGAGLLLGIARPIADMLAAVALQLSRDRRCRAIQNCSDLADRRARAA